MLRSFINDLRDISTGSINQMFWSLQGKIT